MTSQPAAGQQATDGRVADETRFREWLRSLDQQPADVPDDDAWNYRVAAATWDYVTTPIQQPTHLDTDDNTDTDGM